ncbi:AT-rich interactive domain 3 arid3 [Clonorchis sinensis]|uniref:AT-rich interactive domain 3 arid3 n=1 Tax=Clonorchis sinensis TaxID=79923 RepID=G7YMD5_CLOSI|nr:AT-rich interactive domain 3 arid3 [Clonorchis sinensis]
MVESVTEPGAGTQYLTATSSTTPSHNTASMNFSMGMHNLRIQTQSGAPMGLPPNAMVVSMEFGNVLYQGVLFGQAKR